MNQTQEMAVFLQSVRGMLDELVGQLTPEEKAQRGSLQRWSAKDMLAHLAFWESHFNRQLEKAAAGERVPTTGDYLDLINDGVLIEHMEQPFEDALADEEAAYQDFLKISAKFPPEEMEKPGKYPYLNGFTLLNRAVGSFGYHPAAHISDFYLKRGQADKAREIQETIAEKMKVFSGWEANAPYNLACFYSLNGWYAEAIEKLREAFSRKPGLIIWAQKDSDLDPVREMLEYQKLINK